MIQINHKRITNGKNVWFVDSTVEFGRIVVTEVHGDINDQAGIKEAVDQTLMSNRRYQRVMAGG